MKQTMSNEEMAARKLCFDYQRCGCKTPFECTQWQTIAQSPEFRLLADIVGSVAKEKEQGK